MRLSLFCSFCFHLLLVTPSEAYNATNITLIFLRRHRKAGSTTVFEYLMNVIAFWERYDNQSTAVELQQEEYGALNYHCILGNNALLRKPSTLLVTHLREPISRLNSEYWFKGPGDKLGIATENAWRGWMNMSRPRGPGLLPSFLSDHGSAYNAGVYFDNYYIRMMSAECGGPKKQQKVTEAAQRGSGECMAAGPHTGRAAKKHCTFAKIIDLSGKNARCLLAYTYFFHSSYPLAVLACLSVI